jgi:hypothetical protein
VDSRGVVNTYIPYDTYSYLIIMSLICMRVLKYMIACLCVCIV